MPTGLNIRDFTKVYRELRYANEGALRLSEVEHNAYLNRLTVEVTHYDANRAINYKTNPENTHWGYLTSFKGSSVIDSKAVKFVRQRVYENINQGIWNYHQNTENFRLGNSANVAIANEIIGQLLDESIPFPGIQTLLQLIESFEDGAPGIVKWLFAIDDADDSDGPTESADYTAFPIASPYPDVFKFKADIPVSFLFRLESWYLVNPAVYITANPTDTSDETEGEDEYPEPQAGDGDGDSQEFPESSPNDPENDPRDGGQKPTPPLEPGTGYTWNGAFSGVLLGGGGQPENYTAGVTFSALGNQFPFTARATSQAIISKDGETFYSGLEVLDRFGQVIGVFYQGTGFRAGAHTISVTATVNM